MKKRWLSSALCLLVLLAAFALIPTHTSAATSGSCGVSARWWISGKTLYIGGTGDMYDYEADEAPWADYVSSGNSSGGLVTSIVIQNGVTSIGDYAFYGSCYVTSVSIGSGVTEIGKYAFSSVEPVTTISIPFGVKVIDDYAFSFCYDLTQVSLPDSLEVLGVGAFAQCTGLTSVHIPASVHTFGAEEYSSWESSVFSKCTGIKQFTVDADNSILCADDGVLYSKDMTRLLHYPLGAGRTSYVIADGVTHIGYQSFGYCKNLQSVTVPKTVAVIEEYAFYYSSALSEIIFCGDAPEMYVSSIFAGDTLTAYYPITRSSWTSDVMQNYGGNITWAIRGENGEIAGYHGDNVVWLFNQDTGTLTILGSGAIESRFSGSYMPWYSYSSQIKTVVVESGITVIPSYTFEYLEAVTTISLPDTLTTLALNAFNDCANLNNLMLPASITTITGSSNTGYPAFIRCESLTDVYYMGTQTEWLNIPKAANVTNANVEMDMHFLTLYENPPTCTENGTQSYYAFDDTSVYSCMFDLNWDVITNPSTIPALGHDYGAYEIAVKPTFTTTGQKQKVCSVCGDAAIEAVDMLVGKVAQWNIVLQDDFKVNYYLQISESIESTAKVRLIVGDEMVTHQVSGLEKTEDGHYYLTAHISAAQMNECIIVMVVNGSQIGSTATYSVRQYCDAVLADESYSRYHTLVKEMLSYGGAAQSYFGYNTEELASDGITDAAVQEVPEAVTDLTLSGAIEGMTFYGASLVYRDRIAVRYYFAGDVSNVTFTANGNTYTPVAKDDMYYVEIADILPQDLDQQITLTVTDADGNVLSVTYGPMNYIVRMNEKGSKTLKNLMRALYNYHLAAKELSA